jgi:hypothetical protein
MYKPSQRKEQWLLAKDGATNITCDTGNSQPICTAKNDTFGGKLCGWFIQWYVLSAVF